MFSLFKKKHSLTLLRSTPWCPAVFFIEPPFSLCHLRHSNLNLIVTDLCFGIFVFFIELLNAKQNGDANFYRQYNPENRFNQLYSRSSFYSNAYHFVLL